MNTIIKLIRLIFFAIVITAITKNDAMACGQCQFAYFDYIMPPIQLWCAIAVIWFFLTAIISAAYGVKLKGMPKIATALVLLVIGLLASVIMLGALSLLPFIIPPAISFVSAIRKHTQHTLPSAVRKAVIVLGIAASTAIIAAVGLSATILVKRTDAEFVVKWDGTLPAIGIFNGIMSQKPEPIETYRYIVDHSNGSHRSVKRVVERIGAIGDPKTDIPRLYKLLDRSEDSYKSTIKEALDSLTAREADSTSNRIER